MRGKGGGDEGEGGEGRGVSGKGGKGMRGEGMKGEGEGDEGEERGNGGGEGEGKERLKECGKGGGEGVGKEGQPKWDDTHGRHTRKIKRLAFDFFTIKCWQDVKIQLVPNVLNEMLRYINATFF